MTIKVCLQCNMEFTWRRVDAKFCSGTCRQSYWISDATRKRHLTRAKSAIKDEALLRKIQANI